MKNLFIFLLLYVMPCLIGMSSSSVKVCAACNENGFTDGNISKERLDGKSKNIDPALLLKCSQKNTVMLVRDGYVTLYSLDTHCPVYVSWLLTKERIDGEVQRCKQFFADEEIGMKDRVTNNDYKGSGWSRGHMCPAADNKDSEVRMRESCLLTNICPQDMGLNSGRWNDLENRCRSWARKGYKVYVYCGPVFNGNGRMTIGKDVKVCVPDGFWKVVKLIDKKGKVDVKAYMFPNKDVEEKVDAFLCSVEKVEKSVGVKWGK